MRGPAQRPTRLVPELIEPTKSQQSQKSKLELATERETTPIQFYHSPTVLRECPSPYGPRPLSGPPERRTPDERKSYPKPRPTRPSSDGLQQHGVFPMWTVGTLRTRLPSTLSSGARPGY